MAVFSLTNKYGINLLEAYGRYYVRKKKFIVSKDTMVYTSWKEIELDEYNTLMNEEVWEAQWN